MNTYPSQLSVSHISIIMQVSEKWVYQKKESIPGYYKLPGTSLIRFDRETFFSWIKKNCTQAKPTKNLSRETLEDPHGLMS